eukprot:c20757_g1_i1 orf=231-1370(-)
MAAGRGVMSFGMELLLCASTAVLSRFVIFAVLRCLDSNSDTDKKATQRKKDVEKRLGRSVEKTNAYENIIACDVVNLDDINVTFDSIGGLESVKQSLHELVILPFQRPELFSHGKLLCRQKSVLLYGPPGTGKTLLAKAIAKESQSVFINVQVSTLMSKWFGESQKLVTAIFTLAYKLQPCIIFIDEVDSFLGQRRNTEHECVTNMKTEFMVLWDGFNTDHNSQVMVLAATNRPWELDDAVLRRFSCAFEVGLPDLKQRGSILRIILKDENVEDGIEFDYLASLCEGYSGSDLTELCKQAAYLPIRDLLEQERSGNSTCKTLRPLCQADFENALFISKRSKAAATQYYDRVRYHNSRTGVLHEETEQAIANLLKSVDIN